jgi:lipopolysaccharide export system protein LptA
MQGGVRLSGSAGLQALTPTLTYSEENGIARSADGVNFVRGPAVGEAIGLSFHVAAGMLTLEKDVRATMPMGRLGQGRITASSAVYDTRADRLEMRECTTRAEQGELFGGAHMTAQFGADGGLLRLEADSGFLVESPHPIRPSGPASPLGRFLALDGGRTLRGEKLALVFDEQGEPSRLEIIGDATLSAGNKPSPTTIPSSLAARTLTFDMAGGSITRARAEGEVTLRRSAVPPAQSGFSLDSENLDASFDPNLGTLLKVEGQGAIHMADQDMQSDGSRSWLDPATDTIIIAGDPEAPASATWKGRRIEAQRIEADRKKKTLAAKGGVRASFEPQPAAAPTDGSLPFFSSGETIHAMAGSLTLSNDGRAARYEDRVRIWQGESRLEAATIEIDEVKGTLRAQKDIISTFRQPRKEGQPAPASLSDEIINMTASAMVWERLNNRVVYTGHVVASLARTRVAAEKVTVFLAPEGGSAERMEAEGAVEVRDAGRVGRGDHLQLDLKADTLVLKGAGREATIQDEAARQVVRGRTLTMDRSGDRILVESEQGGRTWITLPPRQKGAPSPGADSRN